MNLPRMLFTAFACAAVLPAIAQIVECIDADGKKTYAKTCPMGAVKQRAIETSPMLKQGPPDERARQADALKVQERTIEQRRQQRLQQSTAEDAKEGGKMT